MNKHAYKQNAYYLIYLIRCVLNNKIPAKEKLDKMDLSGVFAVAKAHSLTAIAAYALESVGIYDKAFEEEKAKTIRKNILLDVEREKVLAELEKAGIWYLPLKRIILKEYYPMIGMRQMADNDILFDASKAVEVKEIMGKFGFSTESFDGGNHDVYHKQPIFNFEMHQALFGPSHDKAITQYYYNVKNRLVYDINSVFSFQFSDEDFYIYITAHEYMHYKGGGTGLRNLVDRYVYLNHFDDSLNMTYIEQELAKMQIDDYERTSREMLLKLFTGQRLTTEESKQLDYYIFSGTYGTTKNSVNNIVQKLGGDRSAKWKYALDRFSVPFSKSNPQYKAYKATYSFFYEHMILLPVLPFYRLFRSLYKSRKSIMTEIKTLIKL